MLDTIKKYYDFTKTPEENKIFFGINCGTLWFILNDIQIQELPKTQKDIEIIKAYMIQIDILKKDGTKKRKYALNDLVIGGNLLDYYNFSINSSNTNYKFDGTGLIVSTALGSSAYWMNNGGPMMPVWSLLRWISGIASLPFSHKVIKSETLHIKVKWRKTASVGVDGYGWKVSQIDSLILNPMSHYVKLAFVKNNPFDVKRILLAEKKLIR